MKGSSSNRTFGFVMAAGFLGLAVLFYLRKQEVSLPLLVLAGLFAATALAYPNVLEPLRKVWLKIGGLLGFVNARIILSLIYFALITPCSFILRLLQRRPIQPAPDPALDTYWHRKAPDNARQAMERQF